MKHPVAKMKTEHGTVTFELIPEQAPNTVASFIKLAREGAFDGQRITRIVPGFVIQPCFLLEDERLRGMIDNECSENGHANSLPFERGTVAMGASGNMASGASFFFTLSDTARDRLQGRFPAFGRVTDGFEELDRLEHLDLEEMRLPDQPENVKIFLPKVPEKIVSLTVETWGETYPEPDYLPYEEQQ